MPINVNNVRFFTYTKSKWQDGRVLTISFVDSGYMVSPNGILGIKDSYYRHERCLQKAMNAWPVSRMWKEIKWEEAIKLINLSGRDKLAKELNLVLPPPIEISEEIKSKLIKGLLKKRARNGDSGAKVMKKYLEFYESLAQQKLCSTIDGRHFYIDDNS